MKPEIMLFDEPTSALDPTIVGEVLGYHANAGRTEYDYDYLEHEVGKLW